MRLGQRLGQSDGLSRSEWNRRLPTSMVDSADRNHDGVLDLAEVQDYFRLHHNYLSLESRQLLLEPAVVAAAQVNAGARHEGDAPEPVPLGLIEVVALRKLALEFAMIFTSSSPCSRVKGSPIAVTAPPAQPATMPRTHFVRSYSSYSL